MSLYVILFEFQSLYDDDVGCLEAELTAVFPERFGFSGSKVICIFGHLNSYILCKLIFDTCSSSNEKKFDPVFTFDL